MTDLLQTISVKYVKPKFTDVKVGDQVRVYTTVKEGEKSRSQYFEGLVIRRRDGVGSNATFTVRRIASGVGVERIFPLHSPIITEIQVSRGAKVRRAQLHYMRERAGKSARLKEMPVKKGERDVQHPWLDGAAPAKPASQPAAKPAESRETSSAKASEVKKPEVKGKADVKPNAKQPDKKPEAKAPAKTDAKPKAEAKKPDKK